MAYTKTTWKNRIVGRPRTFQQQQNADGTVTLKPSYGNVIEEGTPFSADNMNNIENGIAVVDTENSIYPAGGAANVIIIATTNGDYAYAQFKRLSIKATADNTGDVTINVDNQGAVPALKYDKSQLPAGTIKANKVYDFYYDTVGNCFFLIAKASGNTVAAHVLAGDTCSTDMGDIVGSMIDNGAVEITPSTVDQVIPAGYHNGNGKIKALKVEPGDILLNANNSQKSTDGSVSWTGYSKCKEIKITGISGIIRVHFHFWNGSANENRAYARIYRNGNPVGIERYSTTATQGSYTEDISFINGDAIQIYGYSPYGGVVTVREFELYYKPLANCENTM